MDLPRPAWSEEEAERQARIVAALEEQGLDDVLVQHYRRELAHPDQTRGGRNRLRAGLVLLLERRAEAAPEDERRRLQAEALGIERDLHADNRPPDRDENYYVVVAHLARVRGERAARRAAAAPADKALAQAARAQLSAVEHAVRQFESAAAGPPRAPGIGADPAALRRLAYLTQGARLERGLALVALANLSSDDAARDRDLAQAEAAFDRALAGASPTSRRGLEAALGKAVVLRERGGLDEALALLRQVQTPETPASFARRIDYELALTLTRANELPKAIEMADAFLARAPAPADGDELTLRVRLLRVAAYLRLAGQTGRADHLTKGLDLAHELVAAGPRSRVEVLDLLAQWRLRYPTLAEDDPAVLFAQGEALFREGKHAEAAAVLERFQQLPERPARRQLAPLSWFTLGAALFRTKAYRKAGVCFDRLVADHPQDALAPESAYDATVAYENAYLLSREADDLSAYVRSLRLYLDRFPDHSQAGASRWRLAETLLREARDWTAAAEAFARIPLSDPQYWAAVLMVAKSHEGRLTALLEAGPERRAEAEQEGALAVEALRRFAALVLERKDWPDEATRRRARGEAAQAQLRIAQILMCPAMKHHRQAFTSLADFKRDFSDQPALFPRVEALRLQALILDGREAEADAQLAHILAAYPADLDTLRALKGVEEQFKDDLAAASGDAAGQTALQRRLARLYGQFVTWLAAQRGDYRNYLFDYTLQQADHLRRAGQYADALPLLERLEPQQPDLANLLEALAQCYEETGQYDRALDRYRRLVDHRPRGSEAWFEAEYKVALMHLRRGTPKEGLRVIAVLRIGWPDLGSPEMKARFSQLERQLEAAQR